ncbi:MAG TPA: L,D-transpeptidase [Polyangiaceae bacterium]|nr:L,D-transpeptidase [Polyangiaceae bacterium]
MICGRPARAIPDLELWVRSSALAVMGVLGALLTACADGASSDLGDEAPLAAWTPTVVSRDLGPTRRPAPANSTELRPSAPAKAAKPKADAAPLEAGAPEVSSDVREQRDPAALEPNDPIVVATRAQTSIYVAADTSARVIGYLRSGASVARTSERVKGSGSCSHFYAIAPQGYVCASEVSTDPNHILVQALDRRPDRDAGLPYVYGQTRRTGPVLYNRLPTSQEQREREPEGNVRLGPAWRDLIEPAMPPFLSDNQPSLRLNGHRRSDLSVASGRAIARSAFAFVHLFEAEGRAYGLATDLSLVPLDHLDFVRPSTFAGVPLGGRIQLPLVFVRAKNASLYSGNPGRGLKLARQIEYREALGLSGQSFVSAATKYLETTDGLWLIDGPLVTHIDEPARPPATRSTSSWIDVSIRDQTLVAYEGETAVYATLVSTGADGLLDTETHRATVQGDFLIHTKHVTSTMDSDAMGDEYAMGDVPYVQYFSGGTALHAAYWHDDFGAPRSHGCVNLSPLDARWLFDWTLPRVPRSWHGAMTVLGGTLVRVHP